MAVPLRAILPPKAPKLFSMPRTERNKPVEILIEMRNNLDRYLEEVNLVNDLLLIEYLAGKLDKAGHTVEVAEKNVGSKIEKFLRIDGKA